MTTAIIELVQGVVYTLYGNAYADYVLVLATALHPNKYNIEKSKKKKIRIHTKNYDLGTNN